MKRASWFVAIVLVVAGCGGGASTSPGQSISGGRTPGPQDATWNFAIEEVGLGHRGYVTLHNFTDVASSLDALFLCQADGCVDLPDEVIEPGGFARIALASGEGLQDVVLTDADLALTPADGEFGLYVSEEVRNASDLRAYLQWGSTPHELTEVAVKVGLWQITGYAPSAPHATRLFKTDVGLWVWDPGT